jgi:fumarate hydratase class II
VVGNDAAVTFAVASCSTLQLTTAMPVIARSVLSSVTLLSRAASLLAERCIDGLRADAARMLDHAMASPALATIVAPTIGYDVAAMLVHDAAERGVRVADLLAERGDTPCTEEDLLRMAWPHPADRSAGE